MDKYNPLNIENEKKYKPKIIIYIKNYDEFNNSIFKIKQINN
ncbi:hypothetical protein [Spiroplasma citri]|nr:hypothetical protein [Spiroplasma citri]